MSSTFQLGSSSIKRTYLVAVGLIFLSSSLWEPSLASSDKIKEALEQSEQCRSQLNLTTDPARQLEILNKKVAIEDLLRKNGIDLHTDAFVLRAKTKARLGDYKGFISDMLLALTNPENKIQQYYAFDCLKDKDDKYNIEAVQAVLKVLQNGKNYPEQRSCLLDKANQIVDEALVQHASSSEKLAIRERIAVEHPTVINLSQLAHSYLESGNFAKAEEFYNKAIEKAGPDNREMVIGNRGNFYFETKNFEKAYADLSLVPNGVLSNHNYRLVLLELKKFDELEKYLSECIKGHEYSPSTFLARASFYFDRQEFRKSIADLAMARSLKDPYPEASDLLNRILIHAAELDSQKKYIDASMLYQTLAELVDRRYWLNAAEIAAQQKSFGEQLKYTLNYVKALSKEERPKFYSEIKESLLAQPNSENAVLKLLACCALCSLNSGTEDAERFGSETARVALSTKNEALISFVQSNLQNLVPGLNRTSKANPNEHISSPDSQKTKQPGKRADLQGRDIARIGLRSTVFVGIQDEAGTFIGNGSGFFVAPNIVATNRHVVKGMRNGYVNMIGRKNKFPVKRIICLDSFMDLALIEVDCFSATSLNETPKAVTLGDGHDTCVGDPVYVWGNPRGVEGVFSQGNISGVQHVENFGKGDCYTVTAPISPGNSGGPMFDSAGEVIGIIVGTHNTAQNLNYTIPVSYLKELIAKTDLQNANAGIISSGRNAKTAPLNQFKF